MEFIEPALFILFIASISVPIATKFRLPLEVFLVIGSCLISFIPALPYFQVDPLIVFRLFLPIILFYAAYFTSWRDFKANIRPISLLAFGLVIFTMLVVAVTVKYLFADFTWAESLLLGAIISPTDASAATSIIRKLHASKRIITILEGESLINDAAALLLFKFSLAAIVSGEFSLPPAMLLFGFMAVGGAVIGIVIAMISAYLLPHLKNASAETTLTFVTAFTCYLVAEHSGFSSVIATVTGGLYYGLRFPELTTSNTRISANASWKTLLFIINCFAFTLIGLELPTITKNLSISMLTLIGYGILICLMILIARVGWVFSIAYLSRSLFPMIKAKDPMPPWQALFTISWCGMRGIVSLAAALSIPFQLTNGAPFPHRDIFLFLTFVVIVVTLITPTITLEYIYRFLKYSAVDTSVKDEAIARIASLQAAINQIETIATAEQLPEDVIKEVQRQIQRRLRVINSQLDTSPHSTLDPDYMALKRLTFLTIETERKELIDLRHKGEINDDIFHQLMDELDFEEMRAKTLRI